MLTLIPLVMPGMIIGIFFSAMLMNLNISNPFFSIVLGHTVLTLPYSIRIMSAGFKAVPQDLIDASRDLGAGIWGTFCNAYLPLLKPSFGGADFLLGEKSRRIQHRLCPWRTRFYYRSDHSLFLPRLLLCPPRCSGGINDSGDPQCHFDDHH